MVKLPGLDDLKKMGSDLLDSAKTVDLGGMVDKFKTKTGIESVKASDGALGTLLQEMSITLTELSAANAAQATAIKKMQNQLAEMTRIDATTYQPKNEGD